MRKGGSAPIEVTDSWINVNKGEGDFNKIHHHIPALYSGVYYACPPSESGGRLNGAFVLPVAVAGGEGAPTELTFSLMRPVRGTMLLFPAAMLHAVLPSYSDEGEERISIGFNVSPFW